MLRRLMLAVLLAASLTLNGVSACSTGPCVAAGDTCKDSDECCGPGPDEWVVICFDYNPNDRTPGVCWHLTGL